MIMLLTDAPTCMKRTEYGSPTSKIDSYEL